jgi:hypothetical protein
MNAVDTPGKSEDHQYMLRVRIDPLNKDEDKTKDGKYIEGKTMIKYDENHDCMDHIASLESGSGTVSKDHRGSMIHPFSLDDSNSAPKKGLAKEEEMQWSHDTPGWNEVPVPAEWQGGKNERDQPLVQPWFSTVWTGQVDFADVYSLGNVYNNLCSDASDDVEWSIGAFRNFSLFSCNRGWANSHVKYWPDICPREGNDDGVIVGGDQSPRGDRSPNGTPRGGSPKAAARKDVDREDLRYWLNQAYRSPDRKAYVKDESKDASNGRKKRWVAKGLYSLSASLRKSKNGMSHVRLRNDWNVDFEPGFPYSNDIVCRTKPRFLLTKSVRTTKLIKAMLGAVPSSVVDLSIVPKHQRETEADGTVTIPYWRHNDFDTEMDSNALFCMRGVTAQDDPGLNVLFTGKQLKDAMKHMTRTIRVNPRKCKLVTKFFLWPLSAVWEHVRGKKKGKGRSAAQFGALESVLFYLRRTTGKSPPVLWAVVIIWLLLTYTLIGALVLKVSAVHSLEPLIAIFYYIWASALCAQEVSNEISRLPADTPFRLAYKQANLSMLETTVTRIQDGQSIKVTAMGFLQMVCRLHEGEEEEEEEEEEEDEGDEEEADPFQIGRGTLDMIWMQHDLQRSLPFVDPDTSPADVIYDYEVKGDINSALDWEERNGIYMQGMQTDIDTGKPTPQAQVLLVCLALLNASIGMLHRWSTGLTVVGDISGEGSVVITCAVVTFVGSYIVFSTLFRVAFRWYTVLIFMEQLAHVLIIEGAMRVHLPCYIDLRHEGNLEGWYCARDYLNAYCNVHIFGLKSQSIVASSLIISALVSFNAVTNYFSDSANIDWANPGGWFSLLNMLVLAALLFLALVALERINAETTKLVKKLDVVGIEVSRTSSVAQTARERILDDQEQIDQEEKEREEGIKQRMKQAKKKSACSDLGEAQRGIESISHEVGLLRHQTDLVFDMLKKIDTQTNDIINRQEIATEYQYLQNIISELRDQSESKKIFGLVVDRMMVSRIFGGVAAVIYLILKETMDALILKYAPPTFPVGAGAAGARGMPGPVAAGDPAGSFGIG